MGKTAVAVLALLFAAPAQASELPPKMLLASARAEVHAMEKPELELLINYIAECRNRLVTQTEQSCRGALTAYQSAHKRNRTVDAIIDHIEILSERHRLELKLGTIPDQSYAEALRSTLLYSARDALAGRH